MEKILIIFLVFWTIYAIGEVYEVIRLLKNKKIYSIYRVHSSLRHDVEGLLGTMCCIVYSDKLKVDELRILSERINTDLYAFHSFIDENQIKDKDKLVNNFIRYKDSYYDMDRVKIMNTLTVYYDIKNNIALYDKLKELYSQYNKL